MEIPLGILSGSAGFIQRSPALMGCALIGSSHCRAYFGDCNSQALFADGTKQHAQELRRFLCPGYLQPPIGAQACPSPLPGFSISFSERTIRNPK
jgi:hypothetical protein